MPFSREDITMYVLSDSCYKENYSLRSEPRLKGYACVQAKVRTAALMQHSCLLNVRALYVRSRSRASAIRSHRSEPRFQYLHCAARTFVCIRGEPGLA